MPPARRPEFEPSFGTRPTDAPIPERLRDQHRRPPVDGPSGPTVPPTIPDAGQNDPSASEPVAPLEPAVVSSDDSSAENGQPTDVASADASGVPVIGDQPLRPPVPTVAPVAGPVPTIPPPPPTVAPSEAIPLPDPAPGAALVTAAPTAPDVDGTGDHSEPMARAPIASTWFRVRKRIVAVCAILIVVALGYYLVSLFQVWTTGRADADGPADAIVVMGAAQYDGRPSPQLEARLDHVLVKWSDGTAPLIVTTGGNLPGDRFTEAEASATYLIERGVPQDAIVLENAGSNSYESLESVAALLAERGLSDVVIVTDPYHALRSRLIAEEVGLDASVSSTETSVVTGGDSLRRHLQEAGGVAVGRIIGFDRLANLVD